MHLRTAKCILEREHLRSLYERNCHSSTQSAVSSRLRTAAHTPSLRVHRQSHQPCHRPAPAAQPTSTLSLAGTVLLQMQLKDTADLSPPVVGEGLRCSSAELEELVKSAMSCLASSCSSSRVMPISMRVVLASCDGGTPRTTNNNKNTTNDKRHTTKRQYDKTTIRQNDNFQGGVRGTARRASAWRRAATG